MHTYNVVNEVFGKKMTSVFVYEFYILQIFNFKLIASDQLSYKKLFSVSLQ